GLNETAWAAIRAERVDRGAARAQIPLRVEMVAERRPRRRLGGPLAWMRSGPTTPLSGRMTCTTGSRLDGRGAEIDIGACSAHGSLSGGDLSAAQPRAQPDTDPPSRRSRGGCAGPDPPPPSTWRPRWPGRP